MNLIINLLRPYLLQIGLGVLALAVVAGGYWLIRHQGVLAAEREQQAREIAAYRAQMAAYQATVEHANQVARDLEARLAQASAEQQKLNGRLKDELAKNAVYRECRVPADGVRLLRDARAGSVTAPR